MKHLQILKLQMPKLLPEITIGEIFRIFLTKNWYKPLKKLRVMHVKIKVNNLDYPFSHKVAHASRKRYAI